MGTLEELQSTSLASHEVVQASLHAMEEARSVSYFQDLWTRDVFKESVKDVFLKMKRTVFSSG